VKILQKDLGGGGYFFDSHCIVNVKYCRGRTIIAVTFELWQVLFLDCNWHSTCNSMKICHFPPRIPV